MWIFVFLLLTGGTSLYILDTSNLSGFFFFFFEEKTLNFEEVQFMNFFFYI